MEKKANHLVASIICGILTAFGIVASIISLINGSGSAHIWLSDDIILLVLSVLIGYYAFIGYKKPHGNLLKYIILISNLVGLQVINEGLGLLIVVETGIRCYAAGRLERVKENLILLILLTACDVGLTIWLAVSNALTVGVVAALVVWLDICVAYFLRYKEHKEAGLADAPKA